MIRINLSPSGSKAIPLSTAPSTGNLIKDFFSSSGETAVENVKQEAVKKIFVLILGPLAMYGYEQIMLPDLVNRKHKVESEIEQLKNYNNKAAGAVSEIKKFKEDESKIQARIDILKKLDIERTKEIQVVDLIQQVIPEKVWIEKLNIRGTRMNFEGVASTDFEISNFLESLSKSIYFMDVSLMSSKDYELGGLKLKKFEISCLLDKTQSE